MKRLKRIVATIFICSVMAGSMSGCSNRLVAGIRKLFVWHPARSTVNARVEQASRQVRPVVTIEDAAGRPPQAEAAEGTDAASAAGEITPELAARYRELAVTKPYDPVVRYNMGRLYLQQGLLKQAAYEFDMATSLDPQFTYAFILLGRTLRMRGLYDLAVAKLNVATRLQPELPLCYIEAGICWDQRGYHGKARAAYLKALALAPRDSHIYNNIGYSFFLDADYKQAIRYYKRALQLDPDDPQTNNNMALAYATQRKWGRALRHFTRALGEAAAQNNIGHLLLRAGRIDEALAHLELAVRLDPNSARALGNLESALRLKGRIDDAQKLHARLVEAEKAQARPRVASPQGDSTALVSRPEQR